MPKGERRNLPRVALFATMAGRGAFRVLEEMEMFCQVQGSATCFVTHEVATGAADKSILPFVSDIRDALRTRSEVHMAA